MTGLYVELRRGLGVFLAPLVVIAGAVYATSTLPTLSLWSRTTTAVANAPFLLGPLAAGFAAWAGMRGRRRNAWQVHRVSVRGPVAASAAEVVALMAWALLAYALFASCLFAVTASKSTWGGPAWIWVFAGAVALCLHIVLGWTIGHFVPLRFTPFAVATALFISAMWVDSSASRWWWSRLFPIRTWLLRPFDDVRPLPLIAQVTWYVGVGLLAFALIALVGRRRLRTIAAFGAAAGVCAACGIWGLAASGPALADLGTQVVFLCDSGSPQVCVHPAYENSMSELRRRADVVGQRLSDTPFEARRFEHRPRGRSGGLPSSGSVAFGLDTPTPGSYNRAAYEMSAGALHFGDACFADPSRPPRGVIVVDMVVRWAAGDPRPEVGSNAAAWDWLARQDIRNARAWISRNEYEIRTCSLTPADFR